MKKAQRTRIETTHRVNDMLEQGGISGRVETYPASLIAGIMECSEDEAAKMDGSEYVPRTEYVTLWHYLNFHQIKGHVVRKGHIIQ